MNNRNARIYDKEFKFNAISLYINSGRSYKEISESLGIPSNTLSGWVAEHKKSGDDSFPGKGHLKPHDEEMMKLRKELSIACEERDILKKG